MALDFPRVVPVSLRSAVIFGLLVCASSSWAYRDDLNNANDFLSIGAYAQAVAAYESALANPALKGRTREKAQSSFEQAKGALAQEKFAIGQRFEAQNKPREAMKAYAQAQKLAPGSTQYAAAHNRLTDQFVSATTQSTQILEQARSDHNWSVALRQMEVLESQHTVPEVQFALNTLKFEAADFYLARSNTSLIDGAYQSALDNIVQATRYSESPEIQNKKLARHHLLLAEQAWTAGRYGTAYEEIANSLNYEPQNTQIQSYAREIQDQWMGILYNEALQANANGDLATARTKFTQISRYEPGFLDVDARLASLNQVLSADFYQRGAELLAEGRTDAAGLALAYFMVAEQQSSGRYPDVRERIADAKSRLRGDMSQRVSLNVTNHSVEPSAAGVVRESILSSLKGSNLKNLQILERDALDDILREQGMGQAFFDPSTAVEVRQIKGIQSGIYVDVVRFDVSEHGRDRPSYESASYKSGTRFVPNPNYSRLQQEISIAQQDVLRAQQSANKAQADQNRLMGTSQASPGDRMAAIGALGSLLSSAGASSQVRNAEDRLNNLQYAFAAEPQQFEEDVWSDYRYEVYDLELTGEVLLSYKIVDFATSEVGEARTARARNTIEDRWVPGDPGKGVTPDAAELPSQQVFKQQLLDNAIESLIAGLELQLGADQSNYWRRANEAAQDGQSDVAIENYIRFLSAGADLRGEQARIASDYVYEELGIQLIKRGR